MQLTEFGRRIVTVLDIRTLNFKVAKRIFCCGFFLLFS
jgi:hypothetical protein